MVHPIFAMIFSGFSSLCLSGSASTGRNKTRAAEIRPWDHHCDLLVSPGWNKQQSTKSTYNRYMYTEMDTWWYMCNHVCIYIYTIIYNVHSVCIYTIHSVLYIHTLCTYTHKYIYNTHNTHDTNLYMDAISSHRWLYKPCPVPVEKKPSKAHYFESSLDNSGCKKFDIWPLIPMNYRYDICA